MPVVRIVDPAPLERLALCLAFYGVSRRGLVRDARWSMHTARRVYDLPLRGMPHLSVAHLSNACDLMGIQPWMLFADNTVLSRVNPLGFDAGVRAAMTYPVPLTPVDAARVLVGLIPEGSLPGREARTTAILTAWNRTTGAAHHPSPR